MRKKEKHGIGDLMRNEKTGGNMGARMFALAVVGFMCVGVLLYLPCVPEAGASGYGGRFAAGMGTLDDPYIILNVWQLQNVSLNLTEHFIIWPHDIDATITSGWNGGAGFEPIGNATDPFEGGFDGLGFNITNLFVNRSTTDDVGLFGRANDASNIEDVHLKTANITGNTHVGGLVGRTDGNVYECSVGGDIVGTAYVGGLTGWAHSASTTTGSHSNGNVSGSSYVGGLIGYIYEGIVFDCWSGANATASSSVSYAGGFAGLIAGTGGSDEITRCYAMGNVTGRSAIGGFVGTTSNSAIITICYAVGDVSSNTGNSVGGFVGSFSNTISDCYALGNVSRTAGAHVSVGGFVGMADNGAVINNSYSVGVVDFSDVVQTDKGFSGNVTAGFQTNNCFWDNQTSGATTSQCTATGKTTSDMQTLSTFTGAGWDIADVGVWSGETWILIDAYPLLSALSPDTASFLFSGGAGTSGDPYQIRNVHELQNMTYRRSSHFRIMNDIDATVTSGWNGGDGFLPVGDITTRFTGSLDGQNYNITNLYIDRLAASNIGLFGYTSSATVEDVRMVGHTIIGNQNVGALQGRTAGGTITNCHSTGYVRGTYSGGLTGYTSATTITSCSAGGNVTGGPGAPTDTGGLVGIGGSITVTTSYSTANVTGHTRVGGMVGYMVGTTSFTDCYATGDVDGDDVVGGFVGRIDVVVCVVDCYSTGAVTGTTSVGGFAGIKAGAITDCFYDTNTSGRSDNDGRGTPKTTAEMQTLATFTDAGWDIEELRPHTTETWYVHQNNDYPRLSWETKPDGVTLGGVVLLDPWEPQELVSGGSINFGAAYYSGYNLIENNPSMFGWQNATNGVFSLTALGDHNVVAQYVHDPPIVQSNPTVVTVIADTIQTVTISPAPTSPATAGVNLVFTVEGRGVYGTVICTDPACFVWENATNGVLYETVAAQYNVTATNGSAVSPITLVTVYPAALDSITISPAPMDTVEVAVELPFTVEGRDEFGNLISTNPSHYSWRNATVGVFNETIAGDYDVSAYSGSINSPITVVTATPGPVYSVEISPSGSITLPTGEETPFSARALDVYGNLITDNVTLFTWENATNGTFYTETPKTIYMVRAGYSGVWSNYTEVTTTTYALWIFGRVYTVLSGVLPAIIVVACIAIIFTKLAGKRQWR